LNIRKKRLNVKKNMKNISLISLLKYSDILADLLVEKEGIRRLAKLFRPINK